MSPLCRRTEGLPFPNHGKLLRHESAKKPLFLDNLRRNKVSRKAKRWLLDFGLDAGERLGLKRQPIGIRGANKMPLSALGLLAELLVLSASARLAKAATLHFVSASKSKPRSAKTGRGLLWCGIRRQSDQFRAKSASGQTNKPLATVYPKKRPNLIIYAPSAACRRPSA